MGYNKSKTHRGSGAKGKGGDIPRKKKLEFGDYFFVNIELSAEEKEQYKADVGAGDWVAPPIDEYLGQGYTVKFSLDANGGAALCVITCTDVDNGDAGAQLTGRGGDSMVAYSVASYKDRVICNERTWLEARNERGGSSVDIG